MRVRRFDTGEVVVVIDAWGVPFKFTSENVKMFRRAYRILPELLVLVQSMTEEFLIPIKELDFDSDANLSEWNHYNWEDDDE